VRGVKYIKASRSLIVITIDIAIESLRQRDEGSRCHWQWAELAVDDRKSAAKGHADKIALGESRCSRALLSVALQT
jgi:hypothetical protein